MQKKLENIFKEIDLSIDPIKKSLVEKQLKDLENLSESTEVKMSKSHLRETLKNLDKQKHIEAMDASFAGLQSMQALEQSMDEISEGFSETNNQRNGKKFRGILKDLLSISKSQNHL